jgi:hypothetical protein
MIKHGLNLSSIFNFTNPRQAEICDFDQVLEDQQDILPVIILIFYLKGSTLWNENSIILGSNFTAVLKDQISNIYKECKGTQIDQNDLNSIYSKTESVFYQLLEKLSLMHKLLLEEEGPSVWRNQLHLPCVKAQNSESVLLAAEILGIDEDLISRVRARLQCL